MEYGKYYEVTSLVNTLIQKKELPKLQNTVHRIFVTMELFDISVVKIHKDINYRLEESPGTWMVEKNKISHKSIMRYLQKNHPNEDIYALMEDDENINSYLQCILKRESEGNPDDWEKENYSSLNEILEYMGRTRGFIKY